MSEKSRIPILVVEDEEAIRTGLCDVLAFHGYLPQGEARGDDGLAAALRGEHALVLLDIMLPGMSGFDVCEKIRSQAPELPILMLTARGAEEDILNGFRVGADDYVTKPFSIAELMARLESLLRRAGRLSAGADTPEAPFSFGGWSIDPSELRGERAGASCELTRREVEVLVVLAGQPGRIVSRRSLLREVWGYPDPDRVETRTVDMHIAKLRKKLDAAGGASLIETIRGEGYRYSG
jgi:two-component system response regulator RegX3